MSIEDEYRKQIDDFAGPVEAKLNELYKTPMGIEVSNVMAALFEKYRDQANDLGFFLVVNGTGALISEGKPSFETVELIEWMGHVLRQHTEQFLTPPGTVVQ